MMPIKHFLTFHLLQKLSLILLLLFPCLALANDEKILTLETRSGETITLSREQLKAFPQTEFTTTTPWTKGKDHYQGPNLNLLIDKFMPTEKNFRIFAVNGYSFDFTKEEIQETPFVLTFKQNGQDMTLRNKGPSWILVPFDQNPKMKLDDYILNQCIWQVSRIKAL